MTSNGINRRRKHQEKEPSNLLCSLSRFFEQFDGYEEWQEAIKLKQVIDRLCYVLGQTANFYITDSEGEILYANDQLSLTTKLREAGVISNQHINLEKMWFQHSLENVCSEEITLDLCSGDVLYLHANMTSILNKDDKPDYYIIAMQDVTSLRKAESKLSHMYYTDPLTQLPNRLCFEEDLLQQFHVVKTNEQPFAILFLDLDRFKFFNDTLGHTIGDQLIIGIANRLLKLKNESVTLYRFGGDEFTFLLRNLNLYSETEIDQFAEKILSLFKTPFQIEENELMITCSIGVSIYPTTANSFKKLVECADTAMHYAKERGKDTYQIYSEQMNTAYSEKLKIETQLRKAIEEEQFFLNYQPQIELKTKKIIGVEALIRWVNPELGFVSPNKFIPLAEEVGLIDAVGNWVLKTACKQIKKWQVDKGLFIRVGINISPLQFQHPDFVSKVERILKETGLEAKYVDLEITENGLMQNSKDCLKTLERLKGQGFKISIDDFGTGYSSLSYLKRFPIDTLKIDQSFVRDVMDNVNDQAIVTSIISLAHNMKLNVIAEGVETIEIVKFLKEHECNEMQGYLYSKPLPPGDFEVFLTKLKDHENSLNYM